MATDPTKTTWTDERGYERGVCLCGDEASTHPSDSVGGLDFCVDCGRNTCASCRISRNGASVCTKCTSKSARPKIKRAGGKRKRSYASRSKSVARTARRAKKRRVLVGGRRVDHSNRPMPYHLKVRYSFISTPDGYVLEYVQKGRLQRSVKTFPTLAAARAAAERLYNAGIPSE